MHFLRQKFQLYLETNHTSLRTQALIKPVLAKHQKLPLMQVPNWQGLLQNLEDLVIYQQEPTGYEELKHKQMIRELLHRVALNMLPVI